MISRAAKTLCCAGLIWLAPILGCAASRPEYWPTKPACVRETGRDRYVGIDLDHDGRVDYTQRERDGYKDRLYFHRLGAGGGDVVVQRPACDPQSRALMVLLLDGVSFDRIEAVWRRGGLRLFHPPAKVISTFPTLTDVAYDAFFSTGPTPGYEAGYFDRERNELLSGFSEYLRGDNERWVHFTDYRLSVWIDAFMYLAPVRTFWHELSAGRRALDRRLASGARDAVIYFISADGVGHMLTNERQEDLLGVLDAWIERITYDYRGEIEIVMLADHGNSTTPPQRLDLPALLKSAGLRPVKSLREPGDIAVPQFGLLDVARVHTFDAATRDRVLEALNDHPAVELLAWPDGERIQVHTANGSALITSVVSDRYDSSNPAARSFGYEPLRGDALGLLPAIERLREAGELSPDGFASADAWLRQTKDEPYVLAPARLWDGMHTLTTERPDVVVCMADGWFVGSGFLNAFVHMHGTHGGSHRRVSETFVMSTMGEYESPQMLTELRARIERQMKWTPSRRQK